MSTYLVTKPQQSVDEFEAHLKKYGFNGSVAISGTSKSDGVECITIAPVASMKEIMETMTDCTAVPYAFSSDDLQYASGLELPDQISVTEAIDDLGSGASLSYCTQKRRAVVAQAMPSAISAPKAAAVPKAAPVGKKKPVKRVAKKKRAQATMDMFMKK